MINDLLSLDPAQAAAATCDAAVQLTLAGPGAGKTTTLAARFVHLVRRGTDPRRILAVTFTKKAAEEMRARIAASLDLETAGRLPIMTFHAFAYRHLRRNPQVAGLPEGFQLWEALQQRHVFHSRQMWWNEEIDILDLIGGLKERLLDAAGLRRQVAEGKGDLPDCYAKAVEYFEVYEAALREAGAIDFADMVPLLERAMAGDPAYRRSVVGAFDHLLVDEYQDVNPGQLALIAHFLDGAVGLWAVGDDDQTLFTFRASDVRHILEFRRRHAAAVIHILDRNYRSTPDIVLAAKVLIRNNRHRIDKDIRPVADAPGEIVVRGYSSPEMEARQVAAAVRDLLAGGLPARQVAVLYRTGTVGLAMQTALKELGIPFEVRGSGDFWQRAAARLVVGALHYLDDRTGVAALSRLGAGRRGQTIRERLDEVRAVVRGDFPASCQHVRRIVGSVLPAKAAVRELQEWTAIVDSVTATATACGSLGALEKRIAEQSAALRNPPEHAMVLSTVHSAKGLEWDVVFVVAVEEDVLPHVNADDLEEERRIAYVAMTRARRLLGLTFSAERYGEPVAPSRFLREMRKAECLVWSGPRAREADDRLPLATDAERRRLHAPPPAALPAPAPVCHEAAVRPEAAMAGGGSKARRPSKEHERIVQNRAAGLPLRHGLEWTVREEETLRQAYGQFLPLDQMARLLERKEGGVLGRLVRLGLLPADSPAEALEIHQRTRGNPDLSTTF